MARQYLLLPLILLVTSIGFSSVAFADISTALYSSETSFDSPIDFYLLDGSHFTLDPSTFDPTSNSVLSPDVSSVNPSDNLSSSTEISIPHSMTESETDLDSREAGVNYSVLGTSEELLLAQRIRELPVMLKDAADHLNPSLLVKHVFKMAKAFNQFYHSSPVLNTELELKSARLTLIKTFAISIKEVLDILGIQTMDEM